MAQKRASKSETKKVFQLLLPIQRRVVFIDWHGVMSEDVFWGSIRNNPSHPLHEALTEACRDLFSDRKGSIAKWMRGSANRSDILSSFQVELPKRYRADFLERRLIRDCVKATCNPFLLEVIKEVRCQAFVVLATDNMDCFLESLKMRPDISGLFSEILCSSEMGLLKSESVDNFFGSWLNLHHIPYKNALLLDDSKLTCQRFRRAGGKAIVVSNPRIAARQLQAWARHPR